MPEAAATTPDWPGVVPAGDAGQDSMLANDGDGSGDHRVFGKSASVQKNEMSGRLNAAVRGAR